VSNSLQYKNEKQIYPEVIKWLDETLKEKYKKRKVFVYNTSEYYLHKFISTKKMQSYFPDYLTYEIQVDITGIIISDDNACLVFVECKLKPISLKDISQLIGYSKVALPLHSIIISPSGMSRSVKILLNTHNRVDVLEYTNGKKIKVAKWAPMRKSIDISTIIPKGEYF